MSEQSEDARELIPELCRQFYNLGWVTGTGGGLSIRMNDKIFVAPSGVQKERIKPEDLFIYDNQGEKILHRPNNDKLKPSECLPLFMLAYDKRDANCVIHSHSHWANLAASISGAKFIIKEQEMIKGIKKGSTNTNHTYYDVLEVPIIENTAFEKDLELSLSSAISNYPNTNAVLVRNHGVYVWGKTWQSAKTMAECYDYLFRLKVLGTYKMVQNGDC